MSGFFAGGIREISAEWEDEKAGVVRATAVLALALPKPGRAERTRLDRLGIKIGLLIRHDQTVSRLLASGEPSAESAAVSADLAVVFGTPDGYQWSGRVFSRAPTPTNPADDIAEYALELVLTHARDLPQLIPAPSRYGNDGSFGDSHLTSLWAVRLGYQR